MVIRGRKPLSPGLRVLNGVRAGAPVMVDVPGAPPMPETIAVDPVASVEWDRMAGLLEARGVLSQADSGILLVYCDAYTRLVAARHAGRSH
jgi:phage terminase small subunit